MVKPFVKWAGGKRQIMPEILRIINLFSDVKDYYEPFLGGGAVFFNFSSSSKHHQRKYFLGDINPQLINCYEVLRDHPDLLIKRLNAIKKRHSYFFYQVVSKEIGKKIGSNSNKRILMAANFIYLNRTCYNGLYRVNSNNAFNVPLGSPFEFKFDLSTLIDVSKFLNGLSVNFYSDSFEKIVASSQSGDLVYFDPPYSQITNNFVGYSSKGFDFNDQRKLAALCDKLIRRGVNVVISNHYHDKLLKLYSADKYDFYYPVQASRSINSNSKNRSRKGIEVIIYGPKRTLNV